VTGLHESAVNGAIDAARGLTAADQPLLQLARALARQMDSGPAGSRLVSSYVTVVRSLTARLAPLVNATGSSKLAVLRAERGRPAQSSKRRPATAERLTS